MERNKNSGVKQAIILGCVLLAGCAGSAPDYSDRTVGGPSQEARLTKLIGASPDEVDLLRSSQLIGVPVCSSTIAGSPTGWSIDGGNWCVVACGEGAPVSGENRWITGADQNQCLATSNNATELTRVEFDWNDLKLDNLDVFSGIGRSFISDTQWLCEVFTYQIDPDNKDGFWAPRESDRIIYRFHSDGRLVIGRTDATMKLAGSWRVDDDQQVFFNSKKVFNHAVDYGGGRFDDFQKARLKQVCRYVREADS